MEYLIPLIIFLVIYSVILWRDFDLALFLFVLLLPSYLIRFSIGSVPTTALELMALMIIGYWFWAHRKDLRSTFRDLSKSTFFWPGLLLIFAAAISVFFAADTKAALGILKAYFIEPFFIYLVLVDTMRDLRQWKKLLISLGITTIVFCVLAVVQHFTGLWSPTWEWAQAGTRRAAGVFTSPNALGLYIAPITALYIAWRLQKDRLETKLRIFLNIVIICGVLTLFLAVSRGALIALVVSALIILFKVFPKKIVGAAAIVGVIILLMMPSIRTSFTDLASFQVDSGQSRISLYQGSLEMLKDRPLQGFGLASFADRFEDVRSESFTEILIYPHNIFLNFWTETGILGLIALLWFVYLIYKVAINRKVFDYRWLFISALVVVFIHGLVDVPYFKNDLSMLTWLFLAGLAWAKDSPRLLTDEPHPCYIPPEIIMGGKYDDAE